MKIDKFRFVIVDEGITRSGVWFVEGRKDDVYVSNRALGGSLKCSLHASGWCYFGFTADYAKMKRGAGIEMPHRAITQWQRQRTPEGGFALAASINFPTALLNLASDAIKSKANRPVFKLPLAPMGEAVQVALFYSLMGIEEAEAPLSKIGTPIACLSLKSGEFMHIVGRHVPVPADLVYQLRNMNGQLNILSPDELPKPGGALSGLSAIVANDPTVAGYIQLTELRGGTLTNRNPSA